MTEFSSLRNFIELEGVDKGRIKDIDVAWEIALIDDAWRMEGNGQPMLDPPNKVAKPIVFYSDIIEFQLDKLITSKVLSEISNGLKAVREATHDKTADPETQNEAWFSWNIANRLFNYFGEGHGFDYETCNDIAGLPFAEAFDTAYSYLSQAQLDADAVLADFMEK